MAPIGGRRIAVPVPQPPAIGSTQWGRAPRLASEASPESGFRDPRHPFPTEAATPIAKGLRAVARRQTASWGLVTDLSLRNPQGGFWGLLSPEGDPYPLRGGVVVFSVVVVALASNAGQARRSGATGADLKRRPGWPQTPARLAAQVPRGLVDLKRRPGLPLKCHGGCSAPEGRLTQPLGWLGWFCREGNLICLGKTIPAGAGS